MTFAFLSKRISVLLTELIDHVKKSRIVFHDVTIGCLFKSRSSRSSMKKSILYKLIAQVLVITISLFSITVQADTRVYDVLIDGEPAKVWASSELESKKELSRYSPQKAFDGDKSTAWAEGSQFGGEGQSMIVEFKKPQMVFEIDISNGFQKNSKTYIENNRIGALDIMFDTEPIMLYSLIELDKYSSIQVNRMVKRLTLNIRTVEKGTKYNDLCISEITMRIASKESLANHSCRHLRSPTDTSWAFCIDEKNRSFVSLGEGRTTSLESIIAADELMHMSRASDLRIEQLDDFDKREVFLFKVTAQFDEAKEGYLFFIEKSGKPLLAVMTNALRNEDYDSFEYIMRRKDINNDGVMDVMFEGKCSGKCAEFKPTMAYIYQNNSFHNAGVLK